MVRRGMAKLFSSYEARWLQPLGTLTMPFSIAHIERFTARSLVKVLNTCLLP